MPMASSIIPSYVRNRATSGHSVPRGLSENVMLERGGVKTERAPPTCVLCSGAAPDTSGDGPNAVSDGPPRIGGSQRLGFPVKTEAAEGCFGRDQGPVWGKRGRNWPPRLCGRWNSATGQYASGGWTAQCAFGSLGSRLAVRDARVRPLTRDLKTTYLSDKRTTLPPFERTNGLGPMSLVYEPFLVLLHAAQAGNGYCPSAHAKPSPPFKSLHLPPARAT